MSELQQRLEAAKARFASAGLSEAEVGAALRRLLHSRLLSLAVGLTGNQVDDRVLRLLKELFPKE